MNSFDAFLSYGALGVSNRMASYQTNQLVGRQTAPSPRKSGAVRSGQWAPSNHVQIKFESESDRFAFENVFLKRSPMRKFW